MKVGVSRFTIEDPYYLILAMRWPTFLAVVLSIFLAANLLFATLFWVEPGSVTNARPGAFGDAFFFSVETLATVGYGVMTPATLYGHVVATAEIFVGMFLTALVTGAFFARFARPQARMVFSETAVVTPYENRQALMVRVASRRLQGISEVSARIVYLRNEPVGANAWRFIEQAGAGQSPPVFVDADPSHRRGQPAVRRLTPGWPPRRADPDGLDRRLRRGDLVTDQRPPDLST